jgi:DmsE family decaheme c-type cytochrome
MSFCLPNHRFLTLAIVTLVLALSLSAAAGDKTPQAATTTAPAGDSGQYAGSATCQGCHDELYKGFERTRHFATTKPSKASPGGHGCESCHGPGAAHVEGGGDKSKIFIFAGKSPEESSSRCLSCHHNSQEHGNYKRGAHASNGVSCVDCHSPHHAKVERALLTQAQPQLCYGCHAEQKAEFKRAFHHRVDEGFVQCGDCHNMHGGYIQARSLRTTAHQDQVCYKCHADKKGPWLFEHVPVRTDGCSACHVPHGSNNARLLKTNTVAALCLQCHTESASLTSRDLLAGGARIPNATPNVPTHNLAGRYQACTMCHQGIHGSNAGATLFK